MHLERVGAWFVAATALLAVAGDAAFAQEHKTYRCKVADVVSWEDDGRLRPDSNPRHWKREDYDGVIIDTLTGAMTHPDGHRVTWHHSAGRPSERLRADPAADRNGSFFSRLHPHYPHSDLEREAHAHSEVSGVRFEYLRLWSLRGCALIRHAVRR